MSKMKSIIIIGGGHAGCEAALAAARIGARVTLFALSLDSIGLMPCNPCIGGSAKGHLVREIDALGGEMGKAIDATFIQSKMLNTAKGPAVYSLRAQADKRLYMAYMKQVLENEPNISIREGEVVDIITQAALPLSADCSVDALRPTQKSPRSLNSPLSQERVTAVALENGEIIPCDAAIVCTGTYLKSRCLYGETVTHTGPGGLRNSQGLSESLQRLGFELLRFKTGTPARIHRRSVDFSKMAEQKGDKKIVPFSFESGDLSREQVSCHLTYTTPETHEIIQRSIHRSAMYSGLIQATGTRYCPSIEDKIVRFADKERHPVFIEPEGLSTQEMYVQGMSSALPADVQREVYRSVPGLESCEIMRNAYAIEYDCINATQLTLSLEAKHIGGLFFAGQICGSSGYEEAAAQGLVAGISAAGARLEIGRADAYIGVLVDDLVTKGTREPYRMMTSRAEYRLLLRQDNADLRLTPKGYAVGLISQERHARFLQKAAAIEQGIARCQKTSIAPEAANPILAAKNSPPISTGMKLADLIKRPEMDYYDFCDGSGLGDAVCEQVNIQIKYEGYIAIQLAQAEVFRKMENKPLPTDIDYESITGLRLEARQKLSALRPVSFGQASRITGVSPADISVLMVACRE
ncbi:MAG: tRNA uridine-5-carboxymethylaminomethyl(34) synthesis enzyme MnmG [Defluviitaleaceae bacterium]|nr:tRNA uridine-5-carboxymethylaminomethyl(34) synthesis enzyme MnmG [Defluviitaleaceae bacterium]